MPAIRKTGKYIVSKEDQKEIDKLNKKIDKQKSKYKIIKQENQFLDNKHRYKPSSHGYVYIYNTDCIKRGKKVKKCYKYGIAKDMKKRHQEYLVGKPLYKMEYYIPMDVDVKLIEGCVDNVTTFHSIKKKLINLTKKLTKKKQKMRI